MTARLQAQGLRKAFGTTEVLRGVDLELRAGEILTLLGPSGCGKSTLLRLLCGLEEPDQGTLRLDGRSLRGVPPEGRDMAMVFQSYALYPHFTVERNIAMPLELRRVRAEERSRRVRETAARLGLSELLGRKPAALSGGQRQRVALARALVRRPSVFLLDEPLSNLDAGLRERTRGELKSLFREIGGTAVFVTHDQQEAMGLSDRIAVMHRGRIEQIGAPRELYAQPATAFVAGFIGNPGMNLLPLIRTARGWVPRPPAEAAEVAPGVVAHFSGPAGGASTEPKPLPVFPFDSESALRGKHEVLLGLRPEDARVFPSGSEATGSGWALPSAQVVLRECLGAQDWLTLQVDGTWTLKAKTDPESGFADGDDVRVEAAPTALRFFDPRTGKRLG